MTHGQRMTLQLLGGEFHLLIETPEDLEHIRELDNAHWFATSVPINTLGCDETFLRFVDTDNNGRIRTDELRQAQAWLFQMLADRSRVGAGTDALALDHIDLSLPAGQALRRSAELILANLGRRDAPEITLADVRNRKEIQANAIANGDGVIPADAARDDEVAAFIRDVGATIGTEADASGRPGITAAILDRFLAEARAHLDWFSRGRSSAEGSGPVMVWGADTPAAWAALEAVREKVEEFFTLCAVAAFDPRVIARARLTDDDLAAVARLDRQALTDRLRKAPLAEPDPRSVLPLSDRLNASFRPEMDAFVQRVLARVVPGAPSRMTLEDWNRAKTALAPYGDWLASRKGAAVEPIAPDKLQAYLDGPHVKKVRALIAEDRKAAEELARIGDVEKLILYQRWLLELANNTVSFPRFYDPERRSMVEAGTLIMNGRRLNLNLRVFDRAAHKTVAERGHIFIMYLEVMRNSGAERFEVASAVTAGDAGDIWPGKRGVFITLDGRQWEAKVLDVIPNPVSVAEALKLPFKRLSEFVGKFVEKFSGARYEDVEKKLSTGLTNVETAVAAPPPAGAPAPSRASGLPGLLIGGGVAFAALGSTFAYAASKMKDISGWSVLKVLAGIFAIVAVPTIVVAILKLRRRNMSALLEASGWAVNRRMRLTASLGRL
ncbi:MAG: hypothetical protein V2A58_15385, partial [Planctomycetota bacterium]